VKLWIATNLSTSVNNALLHLDGRHRPGCGGAKKSQAHPQQGGCFLVKLGQRVCLGPVLDECWM